MRFRLQGMCGFVLLSGLILIPASASAAGTVSCATFAAALRDTTQTSPFRTVMQDYSSTYTNSANGQTIRFLAVKPTSTNAGNYDTLVFFNGTSQITPDWPIAMLASSTDSSALCDHNGLVFSDYPGIGGTTQPADADFTFDNISSNVYNLLVSLNSSEGFNIKSIDPTGWSLGTEAALKFTALATSNSAFASHGMRINKLFLLATKPGGDLQSAGAATPTSCSGPAPGPAPGATYYNATGNQAMCVTSIMDQLIQDDTLVKWVSATSLKESLVSSLFPYFQLSGAGQSPYGPGNPSTICAATVSTTAVTSTCNLQNGQAITLACDGSDANCLATQSLFTANRSASPYFENIYYAQFTGQRKLNFTFDYGSCSGSSSSSWSSTGCTFNPSQVTNSLYSSSLVVNGAPCSTVETTSDVSSPVVLSCPQLSHHFGGVYVFNGAEDMFIRHDYGNALCNWLNSSHTAPCTVTTYSNAGHGVQYDYGSQIYQAINGALPH
jgi:hypothetical protein